MCLPLLLCLPCLSFRSLHYGVEDDHTKGIIVVFTPGPHSEAVPKRAVEDIWFSKGRPNRLCLTLANRVRIITVLNDIGLFHATLNAVLLTACGRGTPGVRARDAAYPNKPEPCVLHKSVNVEEHCVLVEGAKRGAVILECKLSIAFLLNALLRTFIEQFHPFVLLLSSPRAYGFFSCAFYQARSSLSFYDPKQRQGVTRDR